MSFDLKEHLRTLSEFHAPSGYEKPVVDYLRETWGNWINAFEVDGLGSLIAIKNGSSSEPRRRIMLAAHTDEIGMAVIEIRDGYLRVSRTAGIDGRTLQAKPVMVHGKRDLPGVFAAVPPHISKSTGAGRTHYPEIEEQWIDTGLSAAEIAELVQIGDLVTYDAPFLKLKNGLYAGKAMDDRASVAAVSYCLYLLQRRVHDWDVYAVATAQEETHLLGATTAAHAVNPDLAIAIDVSFARQPGVSADYYLEPGKGLSLSTGPNFHPLLLEKIEKIAKECEIPFSMEPLSGNSGTDAWAIQVAHQGIPSALFNLPIRNMHSPVETVSLKDIKRIGRLMAEIITVLDDELLDDITWKPHRAETVADDENNED
ncbi:MAG TPA: hypothetical protein VJZ27_13265 [Aggregatilineales bacterium]|nr:hypothetical protein [Aggregatilineales bacterium]